jgi:hypothetical protein
MPQAGKSMARFHWGMRCICPRSWGCHLGRKLRMHIHSLPIQMARKDTIIHPNAKQSIRHHHQLQPQNGRTTTPVACHGKGVPTPHQKTHCIIQHQHTHCQLGLLSCFQKFEGGRSTPLCSGTTTQGNSHLPTHPLHIAGLHNSMTDIPSHSFGSNAVWHCKTNKDLLTLFLQKFPLQPQTSWTVFRPSSKNLYASDFAAADEAYLPG